MVEAMRHMERRTLGVAVNSAERTLDVVRRAGGEVFDRLQLALNRIDHHLNGRPYESFSMRAPDDAPDEVRRMVEKSMTDVSVWRSKI